MEQAVKLRRHLTPPMGVPTMKGAHAMRRGGARREVSERVVLMEAPVAATAAATSVSSQVDGKVDGQAVEGQKVEGWALNVSRGGVRVILEQGVALGQEFDVTVGDANSSPLQRRARVVWVQEERDGVVAGLEFTGVSGHHRSIPTNVPTQ